MQQLLLVGAGGFLGAVSRHLVAELAHRLSPWLTMPVGTLVVNVVGCFLIGWLGGLAEGRWTLSPEVRLFLFVGLFGGFTTYSSFGWEAVVLARDVAVGRAALHVGLHLVLGLGAVWLGLLLSRPS